MKNLAKLTALTAVLALWPAAQSVAQDFYDDDIYGTTTKAKTAVKQKQYDEKKGYAPADTYVVPANGGSARDVDEYNRRGSYTPVKQSSAADSLGSDFEYTRRIERFYNPEVVVEADDPEVANYYYSYAVDEAAPRSNDTDINVYVYNTDPWLDYMSPYYYGSAWSWAVAPGYYRPWRYYNYWGPTWSLSWGWDWGWGPSWSWGPGWGWGGAWYPPHHHHPGHGPNWGWTGNHRPNRAPSGAWRPSANRPSSSGVRRPSGISGQSRPGIGSGGTRRPSSAGTVSGGTRPSGVTRSSGATRPSGGAYNPSNATRPGRSSAGTSRGGSFGTGRSSSSYRNSGGSSYSGGRSSSGSTRSSSGSSYSGGRSSSGSSRSSGASYSGGSRSSGGGSGVGRSSGGGGGRGGRR